MIETSPEERWSTMLVQAQRFASQENFTDALSRVQLVASEIEAAVAESDASATGALERRLAYVRSEIERHEEARHRWLEERRAMERGRRENAPEELARPLRRW